MAWALGTAERAGALRWPDDRCAEDGSITSGSRDDRAAPARPPRRPAADARGRAVGLPAVACRRSRARRPGRQGGRAVFIAADEAAMRALADTAPLFAPELEVLTLPGWDCLPYDRASPALRVMAERLATLHALQAQARQAATARHHRQRRDAAHADAVPHPPARRARSPPGERIDRDTLAALLQAQSAMSRTDTVARAGRVRGARRRWSTCSRPARSRRCASISSATRSRASAASTPPTSAPPDRLDGFTLLPASEALLDEDSIKRFRSPLSRDVRRDRDRRSALPGESRRPPPRRHGALAAAVRGEAGDAVRPSRRRRRHRPRRRRRRRGRAAGSRRSPIITPTASARDGGEPGSYRPLAPDALYLDARRMGRPRSPTAPVHLATPFHEPESATVLDFGVDGPRDFAPERAQQANVYEAVVAHVGKLRRSGRKVVLASYSRGARERLRGLLADHGLKAHEAGRDLAGGARRARPSRRCSSCRSTTASPRRDVALLTEQDMLGDRLVRRAQAAQEVGRRLPRRTGDALARRPRRPRRSRHRPLRGPDPDPGRQGAARLRRARPMPAATSSTCRSRISTSSRATAATSEGVDARPARRRGVAAAQVADEGAHPRDRRRADRDRRRSARCAPATSPSPTRGYPALRRPLPL